VTIIMAVVAVVLLVLIAVMWVCEFLLRFTKLPVGIVTREAQTSFLQVGHNRIANLY
jgi:hypothetical protein